MSNKNIKIEVDADKEIITIIAPITKPLKLSGSGKSLVVASTFGNIETDAVYQGKNVIIGFTAYIKKEKNK